MHEVRLHAIYGFSKARSCLTNLLESFEERTAALDDHHAVDVIYLDFKKAFDLVPHIVKTVG